MSGEIEQEFRTMVRTLGAGYHPDTSGDQYVSLPDGYDADRVDRLTETAQEAGVDVYAVALQEMGSEQAQQQPSLEGQFLVGMPVGISISANGVVTAAVYLEDLSKALGEDDATDEQRDAAVAAWKRGAIAVSLG